MQLAPVDRVTTIDDLTLDPYPIYRRMRAQTPVVRVASVMRTFLTKASDTKMVKDQPRRFSSMTPTRHEAGLPGPYSNAQGRRGTRPRKNGHG